MVRGVRQQLRRLLPLGQGVRNTQYWMLRATWEWERALYAQAQNAPPGLLHIQILGASGPTLLLLSRVPSMPRRNEGSLRLRTTNVVRSCLYTCSTTPRTAVATRQLPTQQQMNGLPLMYDKRSSAAVGR